MYLGDVVYKDYFVWVSKLTSNQALGIFSQLAELGQVRPRLAMFCWGSPVKA